MLPAGFPRGVACDSFVSGEPSRTKETSGKAGSLEGPWAKPLSLPRSAERLPGWLEDSCPSEELGSSY